MKKPLLAITLSVAAGLAFLAAGLGIVMGEHLLAISYAVGALVALGAAGFVTTLNAAALATIRATELLETADLRAQRRETAERAARLAAEVDASAHH